MKYKQPCLWTSQRPTGVGVDGVNYNFGELHYQITLTDSFTFQDRDGDLVRIAYGNKGQAQIHFDGCTADGSDIEWVQITGSTSKSTFEAAVLSLGGDTPVGRVDVAGDGFRTLHIDGNLRELGLDGIRRGKKVKEIIVGDLGDVDAPNVKRIDLIQADNIIGKIDAQEIKKLIANYGFNGANVTAAGTKGWIRELHAGSPDKPADVNNSTFTATKGIKKAYIYGNVSDSTFEADGHGGKLDTFYISGDVINSHFCANKYKGKLGKFYIDGKVEDSSFVAAYDKKNPEDKSYKKGSLGKFYIGGDVVSVKGDGSQFIADRDLKLLDCAGVLNAEISVGRNIKRINGGGKLAECLVKAGGTISKAVFQGAIEGNFSAEKIKYVRTEDYFKGSLGEKDSWADHFDDPSKVKKVYDKDGRQK